MIEGIESAKATQEDYRVSITPETRISAAQTSAVLATTPLRRSARSDFLPTATNSVQQDQEK
jgi:hypothetical protein